MDRMQRFKDRLAQDTFNMTPDDARKLNVCIRCKDVPRFYSQAGLREYAISALCEYCFDDIASGD